MLQTSRTPAPEDLRLAPGISLTRARAHEATGQGRTVFALAVAAWTEGPVIWVEPSWETDRPMGQGLRQFLDPGRIVFVRAHAAHDIQWAAEEALRSGATALVVAAMPAAPGLTAVRRLHLAAEAGAAQGRAPLGLLLVPGAGGAAGIETRWHIAPLPGWARDDGTPCWRLTRNRARAAPEKDWEMRIEPGGRFRLIEIAPT